MSVLSAYLFGYLQGADFYHELHRDAVALLPPGAGQTWFDIGCGPGLVARLASERGYAPTGFDPDARMLGLARQRSSRAGGPCFVESGLEGVVARHGRADVVSATSLLSVLPDRHAALQRLLDAVAPGGKLLVVETSAMMAALPAGFRQRSFARGRRAWLLRLWAHVRQGVAAIDISAICPQGCVVQRHALLGGLVNAWVVRRTADCDAETPARGE